MHRYGTRPEGHDGTSNRFTHRQQVETMQVQIHNLSRAHTQKHIRQRAASGTAAQPGSGPEEAALQWSDDHGDQDGGTDRAAGSELETGQISKYVHYSAAAVGQTYENKLLFINLEF